MRPLTREEQLDYQIGFIESQIIALQIYLDNLKIEREALEMKEKTLKMKGKIINESIYKPTDEWQN